MKYNLLIIERYTTEYILEQLEICVQMTEGG